jgi:hypothetical protein
MAVGSPAPASVASQSVRASAAQEAPSRKKGRKPCCSTGGRCMTSGRIVGVRSRFLSDCRLRAAAPTRSTASRTISSRVTTALEHLQKECPVERFPGVCSFGPCAPACEARQGDESVHHDTVDGLGRPNQLAVCSRVPKPTGRSLGTTHPLPRPPSPRSTGHQRRRTGPVLAHDGVDGAGPDRDLHLVQRHHAGVASGDPFGLQ